MAIQSVPKRMMFYPSWVKTNSNVGDISIANLYSRSVLLDAALESWAIIAQAPKAGTLDKVTFRVNAVSQAPANGLRVSFQDLTGRDPDNGMDQFRDVAQGSLTANTWITTGKITSDGTDTGTQRVVTKGQHFATVFSFASFSAGDSLNIANHTPFNDDTASLPFGRFRNAAGTWAGLGSTHAPALAFHYSDGSIELPSMTTVIATTRASVTLTGVADPDEIGWRFQLPFKCTVGGVFFMAGPATLGAQATVRFYTGSTLTLAQSVDIIDWNDGATSQNGHTLILATPLDIEPNTTYRITLRPGVNGGWTAFSYIEAPSAALLQAHSGSEFYWTQDTDASGTFTDDTDRLPWGGLLLNGFDDGVPDGGGGGTVRGGPVFFW